jgi:hypothetical protein
LETRRRYYRRAGTSHAGSGGSPQSTFLSFWPIGPTWFARDRERRGPVVGVNGISSAGSRLHEGLHNGTYKRTFGCNFDSCSGNWEKAKPPPPSPLLHDGRNDAWKGIRRGPRERQYSSPGMKRTALPREGHQDGRRVL